MKKSRRVVQSAFLALVLVGVFAVGANCERWCPFGGVEAIYTYGAEGNMLCSLGVSNFFMLGGVLLTTVLLRRAFCGYICPLGTISEWLHGLGRRLGIANITVAGKPDRILSLLKYGVLAAILTATWMAGELIFRGFDPCYALISRHGTDITFWAYVVAGAIALASLLIVMPFCRWLCPFAAVLNPFSRFGLTRVKRNAELCHDCGLCAKSCPVAVPVEKVLQPDDIFQFFFGIKALATAVANRLQEKGKFILPISNDVAGDIGFAAYLANPIVYLVFRHKRNVVIARVPYPMLWIGGRSKAVAISDWIASRNSFAMTALFAFERSGHQFLDCLCRVFTVEEHFGNFSRDWHLAAGFFR